MLLLAIRSDFVVRVPTHVEVNGRKTVRRYNSLTLSPATNMDARIMNKEILDLADRKYQLRAKEIEKKYQKLKSEIQFRTLTDYRAQIEVEKLLPQKLEEKSSALIDCYLQTFETAGSFPEHEDLVMVDRKLERLFCGGHGDETGSLSIGTVCENQELERLAYERLGVRAAEMKIKRQAASNYTLNVHGDFNGPAQLGPNNTQNVAKNTGSNARGSMRKASRTLVVTFKNAKRKVLIIFLRFEASGQPWAPFSHSCIPCGLRAGR